MLLMAAASMAGRQPLAVSVLLSLRLAVVRTQLTHQHAAICYLRLQIDTAAGTSPAKWYPGWKGGGIWWKNKLYCTRTVCSPGWRASCGDTAFCKKKHCRTQNAVDGSVCDISPCVQGNCYNGVCQGGGNAMCPNPANECREVGEKCSTGCM
jgi:hypothetical protein